MGGGTIARSATGDTVTITDSSIAIIFRGITAMTAGIIMTAMATDVIGDTGAGKGQPDEVRIRRAEGGG